MLIIPFTCSEHITDLDILQWKKGGGEKENFKKKEKREGITQH